MSNQNDGSVYTTKETPLAAFLITIGYSIRDIVFEGRFATYIFDNDDPTLQEKIRDFELLRAEANAAQLLLNYKNLIKRVRRGE